MFGGLLAVLCIPPSTGAWCGLGLSTALFAAAAGPLLDARAWQAIAGLPVLWTGIEVLRNALVPAGPSWLAGWLALGYCAVPGLPEAEVASVLGVHGLSLLFALGNTAYFFVLRSRTGARQIAIGVAATILPFAMHAAGSLLAQAAPPRGGVAVVVAAQSQGDVESLIHLTEPLAALRPRLIVWPGTPLVHGPDAMAVSDLAVRLDATIILGSAEDNAGGSGGRHAVLVVESSGKVGGRRAVTGAGEPVPGPDETSIFPLESGRFGLAVGFELATPSVARRLVRDGAGLLVLAAGDGGAWSPAVGSLHERMVLFRAIENRRFVAKSGRHAAFLADPHGRKVVAVDMGLEGAAIDGAAIHEEKSAYALAGWLIEPCSLAGAIGLLALSALRGVGKARFRVPFTAKSPACPPGAPPAPFRT
jgi:apolipoprotein N-acyltransferase